MKSLFECLCVRYIITLDLNLIFSDKSYTSRKRSNLIKKDESKPKKSKSRTAKSENLSSSVPDSGKTSQSAQLSSQCLLYGKDTDSNLASEVVTAIGGRDTALFLFRALGKILYCKRELFLLH